MRELIILNASIFFLHFFSCVALDPQQYEEPYEVITTNEKTDGFGAQVQQIIANFVYAEMNNKEFCYRPFNRMEHNYDNDPDFIAKKEELLNFIGNCLTIDEAIEKNYLITSGNYIAFFDENIAFSGKALEKIKKIFRANKKNSDNYFNNTNFNIAIHLRRPNIHDHWQYGTDLPDDLYIRIIDALRETYSDQNPLFHLYSQGDYDNFTLFQATDVILHLNESVEDTYLGMVFADVLVAGRSSFSYTAGYLSDGIIYYNSYRHAPLPHWISVETLLGTYRKISYNLVDGLPNIYINANTEKIGSTWNNGIVWDKPLIQKFYSILPKNDFFVAIDLGAQTGSFSLLAKYFPNSQWYSFEPIQEAADALKENLQLNNIHNVSVYQKAVTDFSGKVMLKLPITSHWGLATIGSNVQRFDTILEREVECIDLELIRKFQQV